MSARLGFFVLLLKFGIEHRAGARGRRRWLLALALAGRDIPASRQPLSWAATTETAGERAAAYSNEATVYLAARRTLAREQREQCERSRERLQISKSARICWRDSCLMS